MMLGSVLVLGLVLMLRGRSLHFLPLGLGFDLGLTGLKAVAIYRDGSKKAQPLMAAQNREEAAKRGTRDEKLTGEDQAWFKLAPEQKALALAAVRPLTVEQQETAPPPELQDLRELARTARQRMRALPERERDGFVRAAVDPYVNALHRALLGRSRSLAPSLRAAREALLERALAEGPASLTVRERRILLGDPDLTDAIPRRVWELPERERAARGGRPGRAPHPGPPPLSP